MTKTHRQVSGLRDLMSPRSDQKGQQLKLAVSVVDTRKFGLSTELIM